MLELQNDWQLIICRLAIVSLSEKYFSSLSVGNLPNSGIQVGKRDGREQSESAPGG